MNTMINSNGYTYVLNQKYIIQLIIRLLRMRVLYTATIYSAWYMYTMYSLENYLNETK